MLEYRYIQETPVMNKPTVAVTGHTSGIGEQLFNHYFPTAHGFSRSNGYDIDKPEDRKRMIDESADCDVFINSAYTWNTMSQTVLMYELFDQWKDQDKLIVSIGSNTTDGIKKHAQPYTAGKAALDKACEQLSNLNKPCRVANIKFGYVGTERVIKDYNPSSVISLEHSVELVADVIKWNTLYRLQTITMIPR